MAEPDDDCEMCDGRGEADATTIEQYGCIPCPNCVSRDLNDRIKSLGVENTRLRAGIEFAMNWIDGLPSRPSQDDKSVARLVLYGALHRKIALKVED